MQSVIVYSKNKKITNEYAAKICKDSNIDKFEINIIGEDDKSIGIDEIRNFQKKIFLKPQRSKIKAGIVKNAENLTIEAQNALLKILEEPPLDTIIILLTSNKDSLLPTIHSRCKIIELKGENQQLTKEEVIRSLNVLTSLLSLSIGEKLKLAQDAAKTKEEAINFLEKLIVVAREQLIKNVLDDKNNLVSQYLNILVSFSKTHTILSTTNANPRLTLENLFLNL